MLYIFEKPKTELTFAYINYYLCRYVTTRCKLQEIYTKTTIK